MLPTLIEAKKSYIADGSLPEGSDDNSQLEFRTLLDYPVAQKYIHGYIVKSSSPAMEINFNGWLDIQKYSELHDSVMKTELGEAILSKYMVGNIFISDSVLAMSPKNLYDEAQKILFKYLHDCVFVEFKHTVEHKQMVDALRRKYNRVRASDFEYEHVIGHGGFGLVLKVTKKSTCKLFYLALLCFVLWLT